MDKEKIHQLRSKTNIPLAKAIELLKLTDNDIEQAERLFLQQNIDAIMEKTGSDFDLAEKYYTFYNGNIEKAIDVITGILRFRKITKIFEYTGGYQQGAGFTIFGEDENLEKYEVEDNQAFLPFDDFRLIESEFKAVFPLYNLWFKEVENSFDPCSANTFDKPTCQQISQNIRNLKHDDPKVLQFFQDVSDWLDERLIYAHHIMVEGNL